MFKIVGNGQGWCKSVRNWYATKDPMELAKEVTRVRARHGRSHKTLIRKSHLKVAETDIGKLKKNVFSISILLIKMLN